MRRKIDHISKEIDGETEWGTMSFSIRRRRGKKSKTIKKLKSYEKRIKNPFSNTTISEAISSTPSLDTTDEKREVLIHPDVTNKR